MNILVYYRKSDSELNNLFEYLKKDNDVTDYALVNDVIKVIDEFDFILLYKIENISNNFFEHKYKLNDVFEIPPVIRYKTNSTINVTDFQSIIPFAKGLIAYGIKEKIILK